MSDNFYVNKIYYYRYDTNKGWNTHYHTVSWPSVDHHSVKELHNVHNYVDTIIYTSPYHGQAPFPHRD